MRFRVVFIMVLLCVACASTALAEGKPRLAVLRFTNNTHAYWWRHGVGAELSDMLTNELASTKKFSLVERKEIDHVISEMKLGQSGLVDETTVGRLGRIKGAQYLIMATVSSFEENTEKKGGGLSFMGFSLGAKSARAYVAVDLKVVDAETSEVVDSRTIEATSESTSHAVSGTLFGVSGGGDEAKKTPVGKAIRACVVNIAEYLECSLVDKSDDCLAKYAGKEKKRKEKTKSAIDLDE